MLKIKYIGDPVLRRTGKKINKFDQDLENLLADMFDAMHREDGIGLAAPQIGLNKQILVLDISELEDEEEPRAFINPEITESWGESTKEEGCLSIPGVREEVSRPEKIRLSYQNADGSELTQDFDGWLARVLQHEIDHLNGILFVDRISPIKRQMLIQQGVIPETY